MDTPPRRDEPRTSLVTTPPNEVPTTRPILAQLPPAVGAISKQRKIAALLIAALADVLSPFAEVLPPLEWVLDITTAIALFAVLGWRWQLLPALVVEAVPGLAMFPTWVLAVAVIAGTTPTT
jgi:hypothetical protein